MIYTSIMKNYVLLQLQNYSPNNVSWIMSNWPKNNVIMVTRTWLLVFRFRYSWRDCDVYNCSGEHRSLLFREKIVGITHGKSFFASPIELWTTKIGYFGLKICAFSADLMIINVDISEVWNLADFINFVAILRGLWDRGNYTDWHSMEYTYFS